MGDQLTSLINEESRLCGNTQPLEIARGSMWWAVP
jgi:hypothetical protein